MDEGGEDGTTLQGTPGVVSVCDHGAKGKSEVLVLGLGGEKRYLLGRSP